MTAARTEDASHVSSGGGVVVAERVSSEEGRRSTPITDPAAARRIGFKLLLAFVLILVLMLFSADQVDFVYKGF